MDPNLKLKALARLKRSTTAEAKQAISSQLNAAIQQLLEAQTAHEIAEALEILQVIGVTDSTQTLSAVSEFINELESRKISSDSDAIFGGEIRTTSLIGSAIEVLAAINFSDINKVLAELLHLAISPDEAVKKKATETLASMAEYRFNVFYDNESHTGLGPAPQIALMNQLSDHDDADLQRYQAPILSVIRSVLSPTISGTKWSYNAVTIQTGTVPDTPGTRSVRAQALALLRRMYKLSTTPRSKIQIINCFDEATKYELRSSSAKSSQEMIEASTLEVLAFFSETIPTEQELQVVQKIEHDTYWTYYHSPSSRVRDSALSIKAEIDGNAEYAIYKTLIGFEGIFGDWADQDSPAHQWRASQEERQKRAAEFAGQIDNENFEAWRDRIKRYAAIESDDLATFPVFTGFLRTLSEMKPGFATELVQRDGEALQRFLVPMIMGLRSSADGDLAAPIIERWLAEEKNIYAAILSMQNSKPLDLILTKKLLEISIKNNEQGSVGATITNIIVSPTDDVETSRDIFRSAINYLTERKQPDWIYDVWFRKEAKPFITSLDSNLTDEVLANLIELREIDYHAEEILSYMADRAHLKVIDFFILRLKRESANGKEEIDAVPYSFHKLDAALKLHPADAIAAVKSLYENDSYLFEFRGGQFLKAIFSDFPNSFEKELLKIIQQTGGRDYHFVIGILKNYDGAPAIFSLCKEMVRLLNADETMWGSIERSLVATGVVSGEYGFAEAYKSKIELLSPWLNDASEKVSGFARNLISKLEIAITTEIQRAKESIELRKFQYGESESGHDD